MQAHKLEMFDGGTISSASDGSGNAGEIAVTVGSPAADAFTMRSDATISGFARHAGGGNIEIDTPGRIHIRDSAVTTRAEGLARKDRGGNVTIRNDAFFIVDRSVVLASAKGGDGGNIRITSAQFLASADSRLDASSELGVDGTVLVNSPEAGLEEALSVPAALLDPRELLASLCRVRHMNELSRFVVERPGQPMDLPEDWQGSAFLAALLEPETGRELDRLRAWVCRLPVGEESTGALAESLRALFGEARPAAQAALLHSHAGDLWLGLQRYEAAWSELKTALELAEQSGNPQVLAHVWNNAGNWFGSAEDFHEALYDYEQGLQYNPGGELEVQLRLNHLRTLLHMENSNESAPWFAPLAAAVAALPAAQQPPYWLSLAYWGLQAQRPAFEIHDWLRQARRGNRLHTVYADSLLAELYLAHGRLDAARQLNRRALFQVQDMPALGYRLDAQQGHLLAAQKRFPAAVTAYRRALGRLRPLREHLNFGVAYERSGELDDATSQYQSASKKLPVAYLCLGNAYFQKNELKQAEESYKKTIEYEKQNADAYNNLACPYYVKKEKLKKTESLARKPIELNPERGGIYRDTLDKIRKAKSL